MSLGATSPSFGHVKLYPYIHDLLVIEKLSEPEMLQEEPGLLGFSFAQWFGHLCIREQIPCPGLKYMLKVLSLNRIIHPPFAGPTQPLRSLRPDFHLNQAFPARA